MEHVNWQQRLATVCETMREMSLQTRPQEMVQAYVRRVNQMFPVDRRISLSRRDLPFPQFRVTRDSEWREDINPWKQKDQLPLLSGGLFADLIYSDRPHIVDNLQIDANDPASSYVEGQGSLLAIPMFDQGKSLNMVILTRRQRGAFDRERFPDNIWLANLFGRATHNLVLREEVRDAYEAVDREMHAVAEIQHALLPPATPRIDTLEMATYYRTSTRAGGDYYDFFPLAEDQWGILIADVSGHGTPAAVMMAITHTIAHLYPHGRNRPGDLLEFINKHLVERYAIAAGAFVTAFYGIYDPGQRTVVYSSAGHNPPRLWKCSTSEAISLDRAVNMPLGVSADLKYEDDSIQMEVNDRLVFYTDGITDAASEHGERFGLQRLDQSLAASCNDTAQATVERIVDAVKQFTKNAAPTDDRTMVVAKAR